MKIRFNRDFSAELTMRHDFKAGQIVDLPTDIALHQINKGRADLAPEPFDIPDESGPVAFTPDLEAMIAELSEEAEAEPEAKPKKGR